MGQCTGTGWVGGFHEADMFLPNSDFICEPEHAVCEDATRRVAAAHFLFVGRLALQACREGGAVRQKPPAPDRRVWGEEEVERRAKKGKGKQKKMTCNQQK